MTVDHDSGGLKMPIIFQTRQRRFMYDSLTIHESHRLIEVMELVRAKYLAEVHGTAMTMLQHLLLCQDIIVDTNDVAEISFEDEESQTLPTRVFPEHGHFNELLTEAFHGRSTTQSIKPFRTAYPSLVRPNLRVRRTSVALQVITVRQRLNKQRVVLLQLFVLTVLALASVVIGSIKKDPELGVAIGGASLAAIAALQPTLAWLFR